MACCNVLLNLLHCRALDTFMLSHFPQLEARAEAAEAGAALAEGLPALMTGAAALAATIQQEQGLDAGEAPLSRV